MAIESDLTDLINKETALSNNKVSRFAYTQEAYDSDTILAGVDDYVAERDNNIPNGTASVMKVNQTIIEKGWRAQASSITRMLLNHFLARGSYNLNKAHDNFKAFLTSLKGSLGTANGIATLGADGKLNLSQFIPMIETTWASLKDLRDDGELIEGHYYRITDYVTTTVQADTQSAGHAFDVIVRADSTSVLNENAFAIQHEGDTYFENSKLSAWKLKYCLDNDTARFAWADTVNGKGVIYRMIDEWNNDLPYDFKNMQFKRYKADGKVYIKSAVTATEPYPTIQTLLSTLLGSSVSADNIPFWFSYYTPKTISGTWIDQDGNSVDGATLGNVKVPFTALINIALGITSDYKWFYTFSKYTSDSEAITDSSLLGKVFKNKFTASIQPNNSALLGKNVFIGSTFFGNTIRDKFVDNTIGDEFVDNTTGAVFTNNTIGYDFSGNTVDYYCAYNIIDESFESNIIGIDFSSNFISKFCVSNNFGISFRGNAVDRGFERNSIQSEYYYNVFGRSCKFNNFGCAGSNNIIGTNCQYNTIGNGFSNNSVKGSFTYNAIGNGCKNNSIGSIFKSNTIGNEVTHIIVGNNYNWNHFEDGCQNLNFTTNGTESSPVQKYRILAGTAPSTAQTVSVTLGNTIPYNVKQTGASTIDVVAS